MNRFLNFLKTEDGSMSAETVIVFPLLVWAFGATFVYWDLFHADAVSQRAAYTVADAFSRETDVIDTAYLEGMNEIHDYLIKGQHESRMRVSVVGWDADRDEFSLVWSRTPADTWDQHTTASINDMADQIPAMAVGDIVIIVEAQVLFEPFLNAGLKTMILDDFVVTRPRFGPQLVWEDPDGTRYGMGSEET